MRTRLLCAASGLPATGLALALCHRLGERGSTLWIVGAVTLLASCSAAFAAALIATHSGGKRERAG